MKDLQLRLKRFVKDDQTKDERIAQMEKEKRDLTESLNKLEQLVAETRTDAQNNNEANATGGRGGSSEKSSVCVIL